MSNSFDAYRVWLGISPRDQPPNHYRLLAVDLFESDPEVIRDAAQQRMAHVRNYQLRPNLEMSQRILNELAVAKACLLDRGKKAAYDDELRHRLEQCPAPPVESPVADLGAMIEQSQRRLRTPHMGQRSSRPYVTAIAAGGVLTVLATLGALLFWPGRPSDSEPTAQGRQGKNLSLAAVSPSSEPKAISPVEATPATKADGASEPLAKPQSPLVESPMLPAARTATHQPPSSQELAAGTEATSLALPASGSATATEKPLAPGWPHRLDAGNWTRCITFSRDGLRMANVGNDGVIQIRDGRTGQLLRNAPGDRRAQVHQAAFSPDGSTLVTVDNHQAIIFWDAATGALRRSIQTDGSLTCVAYSPDGRIFATGGSDKKIAVRDADSGELLQSLAEHRDEIRSVVFSPDGGALASCGMDFKVKLWDVKTWRCRYTFEHPGRPWCVTFSPDGARLAVAHGATRVWEVAAGRLLFSLGSSSPVSVAYSPDGKYIATGGEDGTVQLWDATNGDLLQTLKEHRCRFVRAVSFHPGGKMLLSAGDEGTILCWHVDDVLKEAMAKQTPRVPVASSEHAAIAGDKLPDDQVGKDKTGDDRNVPAVARKAPSEAGTKTLEGQVKPKRDVAGRDRDGPSVVRQGEELGLWLVAGPFSYESLDKAYDDVHPIEKGSVDITAKFGLGKKAISWRPYEGIATVGRDTGANIVLAAGPPATAGAAVYYAACWVKFPQNTQNLETELHCKCPCKCWFNGKPLHGTPDIHGTYTFLHPTKDETNKWNEVLVKMVVPWPWTQKWAPLMCMSARHRKDEFGRAMEGELPKVTIDQPTDTGFRAAPIPLRPGHGSRPR